MMYYNSMEYISSQEIKDKLTEIKEPPEEFTVRIINKKNCTCSGYYRKCDNTITIYLNNHNNKNELYLTAIHEYAHHMFHESIGERMHCTKFWICYFDLMNIAEIKGIYDCNIKKSKKLSDLTKLITKYNLFGKKTILNDYELSILFKILNILCIENNIDFQYYTVKYLKMEWFKSKNPMLSYGNLFRKNHIGNISFDTDDFIFNLYEKVNLDF